MDQVFMYQKPDYVNLLNEHFDAIVAFTEYWKGIAYKIGVKKEMPIFTFPHGFDHDIYFPVLKDYVDTIGTYHNQHSLYRV